MSKMGIYIIKSECISCHAEKPTDENGTCQDCWEWHEKDRMNNLISSGNYKNKKAYIPSDIRWTVWERDNFTCKKCGARRNLTIDHVYPESKGGKASLDNCQTLCRSCNSSKGAR